MERADLVTHAVTLTFDQAHIYAFLSAFSDGSTPRAKHMVERYQKGMLKFSNALDKGLFGHSSGRFGQRMFFAPILEGLSRDRFPHWHCALGIPQSRWDNLGGIVDKIWRRTQFGGFVKKIDLVYSSEGWINYITKCAKYPDRQSVHWESVRIPVTAAIS